MKLNAYCLTCLPEPLICSTAGLYYFRGDNIKSPLEGSYESSAKYVRGVNSNSFRLQYSFALRIQQWTPLASKRIEQF